jgi:hypothetical protein
MLRRMWRTVGTRSIDARHRAAWTFELGGEWMHAAIAQRDTSASLSRGTMPGDEHDVLGWQGSRGRAFIQ